MYKRWPHHPPVTLRLLIGILILLVGLSGCKQQVTQPVYSAKTFTAPTSTSSPVPATLTSESPTAEATSISTESPSGVIGLQNAAEVTRLATLGQGMVNGAPFYSTDGQILVIPTTIGIALYESATLQRINSISTLSDGGLILMPTYPRLVALSTDRRLLAANLNSFVFSSTGDFQEDSLRQGIYLWDAANGTMVRKIPLNSESPFADLAFSPDGQTLAAGFEDGNVQLWRVMDGEELFSTTGSQLEFSPDGNMLVTMPSSNGNDSHVNVYSTTGGELLRQWEGQRAIFSPTGLLAVENDGAVRVMDIEKGITLHAFNGKSAVFSADGQDLALLDQGNLKIYQVAEGNLLQTLAGSFETVYTLQFAPDRQTLAMVGEAPMCPNCMTAPQVAVWHISDGSLVKTEVRDPLWLTYAPKEGFLAIWTNKRIYFLDPTNGSSVAVFEEYATSVDGIAFSPDNSLLVANSGQPNLLARLWQLDDCRLVKMVEDPNNPGYGYSKVAFSPDSQILWVQGGFWDSQNTERWMHLDKKLAEEAPPYIPSSVSFSPDGSTMAIGYLEGYLQLWNLGEEKLIRKLEGYNGEVVDLAFSPDGSTLAAVYSYPDYAIQLWKVPAGERSLTVKGVEWTHEFMQVVFSPDGQTLTTVAKNEDGMDLGTVELWRASNGQRLYQLDATGILSVAFSADGKIVATGSYDHTVRLWRTEDGMLLNTLNGHGDYVTDLAFSNTGELLASSSNDGTVILWGIRNSPDEHLLSTCNTW